MSAVPQTKVPTGCDLRRAVTEERGARSGGGLTRYQCSYLRAAAAAAVVVVVAKYLLRYLGCRRYLVRALLLLLPLPLPLPRNLVNAEVPHSYRLSQFAAWRTLQDAPTPPNTADKAPISLIGPIPSPICLDSALIPSASLFLLQDALSPQPIHNITTFHDQNNRPANLIRDLISSPSILVPLSDPSRTHPIYKQSPPGIATSNAPELNPGPPDHLPKHIDQRSLPCRLRARTTSTLTRCST